MSTGTWHVPSERIISCLVVIATTAFVFWQFYPEYIFRNTTPVLTDFADHSLGPLYLRDSFLPNGALTGWSQARFTGYPMYAFYFPFPALMAVALDLILPYNIAFKFTAALGSLMLPVAAFIFGRLHQQDWPTSACYSASTLIVLLQPLLYNLGGSIESTALGEFSYAWALSVGLFTLGLASAGLRSGRYRALTAGLLAASIMSHAVPTATVLLGLLLLTAIRPTRAKVRWMASVFGTGFALSAIWTIPLFLNLRLTAGPDANKVRQWANWLWPDEMAPVAVLALLGLVLTTISIYAGESVTRFRTEFFMAIMALTSFLLFAVIPRVPVEDTRFLPCWYLWLALLAAHTLARLAKIVDKRRAKAARGRQLSAPQFVRLLTPCILLPMLVPLWNSRLGSGLLTRAEGSTVGFFVEATMRGYEADPNRQVLEGTIRMLRDVSQRHGCGRVLSEWNASGASASAFHLMNLAAKWTDGCLTSAYGITMQSSATSPYIRATGERLSFDPFTFVESRRHEFDLSAGIADLRLLGIRYFIAAHPDTRKAASASSELRFVRATPTYAGEQMTMYEVAGVQVVEALRYEPIVVSAVGRTRGTWEEAAEPWYESGIDREVVIAEGGPDTWPHKKRVPAVLPRRSVQETAVADVRIDDRRVRFDISTLGTPVLVKVSYFPNWTADGADGPYRVTPNHMVVVPRSRTVTLRYERTTAELAGSVVTLGGIVAFGVFARRPPLEMPARSEPIPERRQTPKRKPVNSSGRKKRRR